jgi:hypothetical protein
VCHWNNGDSAIFIRHLSFFIHFDGVCFAIEQPLILPKQLMRPFFVILKLLDG